MMGTNDRILRLAGFEAPLTANGLLDCRTFPEPLVLIFNVDHRGALADLEKQPERPHAVPLRCHADIVNVLASPIAPHPHRHHRHAQQQRHPCQEVEQAATHPLIVPAYKSSDVRTCGLVWSYYRRLRISDWDDLTRPRGGTRVAADRFQRAPRRGTGSSVARTDGGLAQ